MAGLYASPGPPLGSEGRDASSGRTCDSGPKALIRHLQGERPTRDLQGGTELDFGYLFEDFDMSPALGPAQETAEEPSQEDSYQPSQEPVDTQVLSSALVDPSPAPAPSTSPASGFAQETAEEPAHEPSKEPSRQPSQEPIDTQVHSSAPMDPSPVEIGSSTEAYISATVVSHRKHILNKPPRKGTQDDHAIKHVRIKRKKGDGDDGEGGGVRLRPKVILKAPTCGT
ncbi:uncharacterized protein LOC132048996 [Lycium ferocissimum]|uniref:uncharacterized protein LOC132048996 n=1 Tax=Lycium ferocissimum TaxID=112874 RepID=UPI002816788E|nr:uncharacterized protein LOC132048996 [Lycium ferocissimum]